MKTQRLFIEDGVLDLRDHSNKVKRPNETKPHIQKEYLTRGIKKLAMSFQQANTFKEASLMEKKKIWERERSMVDPRFRRLLSKKEMEELKNKTPSSEVALIKDDHKIPSSIKKQISERTIKTPKRVKFDMTCNTEKIFDKFIKPERTNKSNKPEGITKLEKVIESNDKTERANKSERSRSTERPDKTPHKPDQSEASDKTKKPYTTHLTVKPAVTNIPRMIDEPKTAVDQVEEINTQPSPELEIKPGIFDITEPVQSFGTVDQLIEKMHKSGLSDISEESGILQEVREVMQSSGDSNMYDCEDFICDYNIQYQPMMQYQSTYDPYGDHDLLRNVDPRLRRKYSVLNIPKSLGSNSCHRDRLSDGSPDIMSFDKSYDNDSIDSYYHRESQDGIPQNVSYSRRLVYIIIGFMVGVLVMSVIANFIYSYELLPFVFGMKQKKDYSLTSYAKYFGGGLIHFVATFFQKLGRVLSIPTQHVYAPKPEYHRWPINPLNL